MATSASQYLRNVGKSMGYIAIDSFKNLAPNTSALFTNAKEFSSELYQTINDFKGKAVGTGTDSIKSTLKNTASETWKNARDDFLSGNWYNKERKAAADNEQMKNMLGFDLSEFDFDFDDFGDSFDEVDKASVEQSQKETEALVGTINGSVASAANTVASVTAKSTDYLASVNNANTAAMYDLNTKGFNNINIGMNAINTNISALVSLAKPLTDHMQNSAVFYAKSTEYQEKTLSLLEQLVKNTTPEERKKSSGKLSFEDYISDSGIDIARLFRDLKTSGGNSIKGWTDMLKMMGGAKGFTGDLTSSPIAFLMSNLLIPQLIGKKNVKSIKSVDDMLKVWGFNAMNRFSKKFNNSALGGLLGFLGIELPELQSKTNIDTSKYIQGKIDWDGQSKKALTEVIPYYLSKMTAIMEGSNDIELFDYSSGKFTKKSKLSASHTKEKRKFASSASRDLYKKISKAGYKISEEEFIDFTESLMENTDYDKLIMGSKSDRNEYIKNSNNKKTYDLLQKYPELERLLIESRYAGSKEGKINKNDLARYAASIGENIGARTAQYKRWEEEGSSFDFLFNEHSGVNSVGIFGVDNNNYSALDYLRGIYLNTFNIGVKVTPDSDTAPGDLSIPKTLNSSKTNTVVDSIKKSVKKKRSKKERELFKDDNGPSSEGAEGPFEKFMSFMNDAIIGGAFDKDNIKNSFKKVGNKFRDFFIGPQDIVNQYVGGVVRRTGLAALSEGEIVIPAQFNPYYKKSINQKLQKQRENQVIGRFFGSYADGTTGAGQDKKFKVADDSFLGKAGSTMKQGFSEFGVLLFNLFSQSVGIDGDKESFETQKTKVADIIGSATKNIKGVIQEHGSDALVGAMIGGGVSLLTGAAINPILGASLGAATGLIMSSDQVKNWLFGTDEKDGITGKYGKELRRFVEDQLPTSLMGGATGGAAGLLLGHPVIGMFLGAGAGFVSQSKKAQEFLFGKIDENGEREGGLLPATLQKKLKEAMPGATAGAISGVIATALGGPFGLVGNMMLGAGIGSVVTSEKFKDWFLGDKDENGKRNGGFISELRVNVFDPVREIFFNLSDRIRQDIRDLSIDFFNHAKAVYTTIINSTIVQSGITGIKTVGGKITNKLKDFGIDLGKIKAPDLKGMSNRLRASNLASGYGVRDKSGKYLTAQERLNQIKLGGLKLTDKQASGFGMRSTEALAGMSMEELRTLTDELGRVEGLDVNDRTSEFLKSKNLENLSDREIRRLRESIKVEGKARGPIDVIRDGVERISSTLNKIFKFGTGKGVDADKIKSEDNKSSVGGILKGSAQFDLTTNAGQAAKKEADEDDAREEAENAIQQEQLNVLNALAGDPKDKDNILKDPDTKKKGILTKLFGEDSIIGKAASFISKFGKWILGGGLLLAATGLLDNFGSTLLSAFGLNGGAFGTETGGFFGGSNTTNNNKVVNFNFTSGFTTTDTETGETIPTDIDDINYKRTDTYSLGDRAKEALVRGIGKFALTKGPAMLVQATTTLSTQLTKVLTYVFKLPLMKRVFPKLAKKSASFASVFAETGDDAAKLASELVKPASEALGHNAGKIAEVLGSAAKVIAIAMVVIDFTSGYQDAEITMHVSNPSIPQRIISGILRAVKNATIIGVLVPDSVIVEIVAKFLGLDGLLAQQAEADAELARYNEEYGTDLTWEQYQKGVLDNKTWTESLWEGIKTKGGRAIQAGINLKNDIQANGLGKGISNYFTGAWDRAKEKTSGFDGNVVSKFAMFSGNLIEEVMPGIIGDVLSATQEALAYAYKGDLAGISSVNVSAFEGKDDPITQLMSHVINPFLTIEKLVAYPIGVVVKFFKDIGESFTGVNSGMDAMPKDILTAFGMTNGKALSGDLPGMWKMNVKGNTGIEFIDTAQAVLLTADKVLNTPFAAVAWVGRTAYETGQKIGKGTIAGYKWLNEQGKIGAEMLYNDDFNPQSFSDLFNIPEPGDDVIMKPLFKAGAYVARTLGIGFEVVKGAVRTIGDMIATSDFGQTADAIVTGRAAVDIEALKGNPIEMWDIKDNNGAEGGFWKGISGASLFIHKLMMTPYSVMTRLSISVWEGLKAQIDPAKDTFTSIGTDIKQLWDYSIDGSILDFWGYETSANEDGDHPVWGGIASIANVGVKFVLAPVVAATTTGKLIGEKVTKIIDGVKTLTTWGKEQIKIGIDIFENDPLNYEKDILQGLDPEQADDPMYNFFGAVTVGIRMLGAPIVLTKIVGKKIGSVIGGFMDRLKADAETYSSASLDLTDIMADDNATYQNIFDLNPVFSGPLDGIFDFGFALSKILYGAFKFVKGFIQDLKSQFSFSDLWDNLKSIANFKKDGGSGSGIGAGASGFISQRDPRYANQGLGGYSVADMGCGPAAASMVLGNSMPSNINLARKYQTAGGTDLAYFAEAFAKNGKTPIYYNLGAGASGTDMVRDIASGKPVVLMGRDPYNRSKANSPFGPNNHYVVARGFRNGGIVIDDPEASAGGMIYSPSILNNVTAAVGAGRSGLRRLTGIGAGGASINGTTDQIWAFFKAKGYADGAVAGILANIQSESSFRTTAVGDSGHAYGLCQWHDLKNSSSGRYATMLKTAKAMGKDVSDLEVQLTHIHNEIGQAGAGYPSINDPYQAGYNFCVNFERPANKDSKGKSRGNLAKDFYKHYAGTSGTFNSTSGTSSRSSGFSSGTVSSTPKEKTALQKIFGLTSSFSSAISSAANNTILGKFNIGNMISGLISGNNGTFGNRTAEFTFGNGSTGSSSSSSSTTSWPGKQPVDYMRDKLGKLKYDRSNRDPDKGGGDCSSTVAWALTKAGLPVTSDSRWQYVNQDGSKPSWQNILWYNNGNRLGNNSIPVALQPNDIIFYGKDASSYPDHVSHVEMYNGNNELIGHGSNPGTKIKSVNYNKENIIKIVRPNAPWNSASGSGLADLAIKPKKVSTIIRNGKIYNLSDYKRTSTAAGASNISSGIDRSTALILKTMITLIETIVKNTDDISSIYQLLSAYCANNADTKSAEILNKLMQDRNTDNSRIEDNLADLKATVDSILAS